PVLVLALYVLGAAAFVPLTLLAGALALVLPPWPALACGWLGAMLAACAGYGLGRLRPQLRRHWPERSAWLSRQVARRGGLAVAFTRLLPIGGFMVMSTIAGTLAVSFPRFLAANAVALPPGLAAAMLLARTARMTAAAPTLGRLALSAAL